jgi:hypothetical protein
MGTREQHKKISVSKSFQRLVLGERESFSFATLLEGASSSMVMRMYDGDGDAKFNKHFLN